MYVVEVQNKESWEKFEFNSPLYISFWFILSNEKENDYSVIDCRKVEKPLIAREELEKAVEKTAELFPIIE